MIDFDWSTAIIRFAVNTFFIASMILIITKHIALRRFSFTFLMISVIVFFLCFTLKNFDLNLGMALGLFAIFGIIRYRTQPLQTEEMTYLFITIGMAVINALSEEFLSIYELIIINLVVILFIIFGEYVLIRFSYNNKYNPLVENLNRRIVLQLEYVENDMGNVITNEIKRQEENLNIKIKTYKVFKIDKKLNTITVHGYY
tara:strand:+ start:4671 stop:5273 length:603 start_codon:yes stop_codon:yes gene_type:complete